MQQSESSQKCYLADGEVSTENRFKLRRLKSLPNFRLVCASSSSRPLSSHLPAIFRSSRPDLLEDDEVESFKEIGIQCIIDFRSKREYQSSDGRHLLDRDYNLYCVMLPSGRNYTHGETVKVRRLASGCFNYQRHEPQPKCRHYLINFFTMNYVWNVFSRAPWYVQLCSLMYLIFDFIFQTGYKYFIRHFATRTLNSTGIIGQYKDIIEYSQRSICAALKLLCDGKNLPALLNCAHGKDRTGIVSALILSCLGKSPEYIAKEYALSHKELAPVKKRMHREMVQHFHFSKDFTTARSETMQQLFSYIHERYGSVENYLNYIGFGSSEQEMLRQTFS